MPKSKLADLISAPKEFPPIDWVSALFLERMKTLGYNYKTLSKEANLSYDTVRHMNTTPVYIWQTEAREAICKCLGLDLAIISEPYNKRKIMVRPIGSDYWFEVQL